MFMLLEGMYLAHYQRRKASIDLATNPSSYDDDLSARGTGPVVAQRLYEGLYLRLTP